LGYKAGLGDALAHPDVPVFPQAAVGRPGLRLPSLGVADSHPDAVSLLDADHDAVRPVCPDTVDAIPEVHRGRSGRLAWAAGKLAGHGPRLADAVLGHLGSAWAVFPGLPALIALVERWARLRAVAEPYTRDEALSEA
jgi:hypothetical protein